MRLFVLPQNHGALIRFAAFVAGKLSLAAVTEAVTVQASCRRVRLATLVTHVASRRRAWRL